MTGTSLYERVVRPVLFRLEPETAHRLGQAALRRDLPWRALGHAASDPRLRTRIGDLELASPIGLAAGFDKNGDSVRGLQHLGFGYLTIGSILPRANAGNPRPRLIRYPETESLGNCYGLPSDGLDACAAKFRALAARGLRTKLIANINADTVADYLRCIAALAPYADGVELALRCPNRSDHQSLYPLADLEELLTPIRQRWPGKAVFVKLPPYANDVERQNRLELVELSIRLGLAGLVIPGNWSIPEPRLSRGLGSLSGRVTFGRNLATVREVAAIARGRIAIKSSGGVSSGADALQILSAGATMVDILTAFIYRGWTAAAAINAELAALLNERHLDNLQALRPARA